MHTTVFGNVDYMLENRIAASTASLPYSGLCTFRSRCFFVLFFNSLLLTFDNHDNQQCKTSVQPTKCGRSRKVF